MLMTCHPEAQAVVVVAVVVVGFYQPVLSNASVGSRHQGNMYVGTVCQVRRRP